MASKSADFNYKVALASGLKSLQSGRLRQAEEQFRYLVQHFPGSEGGYRGLAKVLVAQEDRPAALRALLDGGASLAKAGHRSNAIAIYREAVALEPADLAAHRRLAAALSLAGDSDGAAHEYARYIKHATDAGDPERAQLEASYALGRMPHDHEIQEIARGAGVTVATHTTEPRHAAQDRESLMRSTFGAAAEAAPHDHAERALQDHEAKPEDRAAHEASGATSAQWTVMPAPATGDAIQDTWELPAPAAESAEPAWPASTPSGTDAWEASDTAAAASASHDGQIVSADVDEATVEANAARYLAKGDPRGGEAALEAARRYLADGRIDAASDLLLQLIAADIADHDAQRLLVEVTKSIGKRDVAKVKVKLLADALRLDGRAELAAEVEQLTEAI